jgi:hypothetical protein
MITFSDAEEMMRRTGGYGYRKLQGSTYLESRGPDAYAVRLYSTDVITIHRDGTFTLRTGGWNTVTTKDRMNSYGPARVHSEGGTLAVWHKADPVTPVRMQKCRKCRGTGTLHTRAYTDTHGKLPHPVYEVKDEFTWNTVHDGLTYPDLYYRNLLPLMRDGQPLTDQPEHIRIAGQVKRHDTGSYGKLPVPVHHPSEPYQCWSCGGSGQRDYGSKSMPVIFYDGIRVSAEGKVIEARGRDRLRDPATIARRKRAEAKAAREAVRMQRAAERKAKTALKDNRTGRLTWIAEHGLTLTDDGSAVIMFKAVRDDLRSAHGASYIPGTTVTAEDYEPVLGCGQGLHFSPAPRDAMSYDRQATRFLACAVDLDSLLTLDDKVKARSCRVLHEVDEDGSQLLAVETSG